MSDIPFEQLLALAAGELDEPTAAAIQQQVSQSPQLAEQVRRLQGAIRAMRSDDSVAPPADIVAKAKSLFSRLHQPLRRRWLEGLREIVATLVYDSRLQPALAGYRSARQAVQLSYSAEGASLDLQVDAGTASEDQRNVIGQVSRPSPSVPLRIQFYTSDSPQPVAECPVDESGMFSLSIGAGRYDMAVRADEWAVVVPDLQVD